MDQLNKKIIFKINKIKEENNYLVEFKKLIMFYKVIIGENIIWIMKIKIYILILLIY